MTSTPEVATASGLVTDGSFIGLDVLRARASRLATVLDGFGVRGGDVVPTLLRNQAAYVETALAARKVGARLVPISTQLTDTEIAHVLADCGARVVLAADELAAQHRQVLSGLRAIGVPSDYEGLVAAARVWSGGRRTALEPMLYTSGTTGRPKGVAKSAPDAGQLEALQRWLTELFGLEPGMRTIIANPLYHSAAHGYAMTALSYGGLVVLEPRFDPERMLALIETHRISHLQLVPTMIYRLLKLPAEVRARHDVSSLRHVIHGAGPCAPDAKRALIDWWGPIVREYYGATETGGIVSATSEEWLAHPGTVGRAKDGALVRILDGHGQPLPAGQIGTIYGRHPAMPAFTYHGDAAKRAEMECDGLVTCGDLGYLDDDGYLHIVDRRTDLILCGGVNVYPAEIERRLAMLPGIADCAVVGRPDADLGRVPVAFLQPEAGATLDLDSIRGHLAANLARTKLPREIRVVDQLPRDETGKVRRQNLAALL